MRFTGAWYKPDRLVMAAVGVGHDEFVRVVERTLAPHLDALRSTAAATATGGVAQGRLPLKGPAAKAAAGGGSAPVHIGAHLGYGGARWPADRPGHGRADVGGVGDAARALHGRHATHGRGRGRFHTDLHWVRGLGD